ncbi:hypothetical protein QFC24_005714 [Naganishia onofrii]|uniref:Uncharacterized protein n=1 Tax=Naganishia onofrii TaxID=1851511 RepID=A0ACC2X734_9TREE|nr:hypothetical protein QFC24_005714 [Naganishia onofrii]
MANAQCTRNATVEAGNTCDIISQKYSVPTYQLALVNSPTIDSGCTNIQPGQELCLGWKSMDCSTTHTVTIGDTCWGISSRYGVPVETIYGNNPQVDAETCNNIYVGEVLCVAQEKFTYPWVQLPSSAPSSIAKNSGGGAGGNSASSSASSAPATTTGGFTAVPTAGPTTSAPAATSTTSSDNNNTDEEEGAGVEYCEDGDTSEDCVDEDELPYCDEQ